VITAGVTPVLFKGLLHTQYDTRMLDDQLLAIVAKESGIKRMGIFNFTAKLRDNKTDAQDWTFKVYD
jgi:hypothetical protein